MKNTSLFNETFSVNKTANYYLSLQLAENFYSYCIVDPIKNRYIAIKHTNFDEKLAGKFYIDKVRYMLKEDVFLVKNYKRVDFSFISNKSTLVPSDLFDKNSLKDYFAFNHVLTEFEEIHFNRIDIGNVNNIFAVPSEITTLLVNRFPEIKFYHQATSLIINTLRYINEKGLKGTFVQLNVNESFFDVVVIFGGKLIFYNSFMYKGETDIVYFILNIFKQLNINHEVSEISISGDLKIGSKTVQLLSQAISHIGFTGVRNKTSYSFKDIPEHYFANLLNLHKCE